MFCSKCGKEIDDSAVICIGCGCPTANYTQQAVHTNHVQQQTSQVCQTPYGNYSTTTNSGSLSSDSFFKVRDYIDRVDSIFVVSVIAIILSLGIGIIFAIISSVKMSNLPKIGNNIDDPHMIAELQKSQRKLKTASSLTTITYLIFTVSLGIGIIIGSAYFWY